MVIILKSAIVKKLKKGQTMPKFIVSVMVKKKKQNRIIEADSSLDARCSVYAKILKEEKIKDFEIIDVKQKGEK